VKKCLSFVVLFLVTAAFADDRPNIVMIMADDLGYECIRANGGTSYQTPVLDHLASEGVRFNHCYAQPLCTQTRCKLMTGKYNVRNYVKFGFLDTSQTTFGNLLRDAGYATCVVGKWQLGKDVSLPKHFGFDEHCLWHLTTRPSRYATPGLTTNGDLQKYPGKFGPDVCTDYACDFIRRHKDHPFLIYYPMIITHCPFEPTPDSDDWNPSSPGSKTYKGDAKYFGDMVTYMDKLVGRILKQLEDSGVRDNTLILFTGDNGTDKSVVSMMGDRAVPGEKGSMTDGGTRVPLIAHWQGVTRAGAVSEDLVDFSDFLPTMCEAAGVNLPESFVCDGRSFLPQLKGQAGDPRDWIYVWYSRTGGPQKRGEEFTRNQRYKLYRTGKMYDIENDVDEKQSLNLAVLTESQLAVRATLQAGLDKYAGIRTNEIAQRGDKPKAARRKLKNGAKKQVPKNVP